MDDYFIKHKMREYDVRSSFVGVQSGEVLQLLGDDSKVYNLCSISKLVTSLLCLKLFSQKKIDLTSKICEELLNFENVEIDVEDCLRHVSGIEDIEEDFMPNQSISKNKLLSNIKLGEYGKFLYSDHGYMIVQYFLEQKFGVKFENLVKQYIFAPLSLNSFKYINHRSEIDAKTYCIGYDPKGAPIKESYSIYPYPAACGLWGNGKDIMILLQEVTAGLRGESALKIDQDIYSLFMKSKYEKWLGIGCFLEGEGSIVEFSSLGWGEGYQSILASIPSQNRTIVVLTNKDSGKHQLESFCGDVYRSWVSTIE